MTINTTGAGDRLAWEKPQLVELRLGMNNVESSYNPASDGGDPGPPDVSSS